MFFVYRLVAATSTSTAAATVAKEEEHEADSDDNPDVFTIKKITQAVHTKPPFREGRFFKRGISFTLILLYAAGFVLVWVLMTR